MKNKNPYTDAKLETNDEEFHEKQEEEFDEEVDEEFEKERNARIAAMSPSERRSLAELLDRLIAQSDKELLENSSGADTD